MLFHFILLPLTDSFSSISAGNGMIPFFFLLVQSCFCYDLLLFLSKTIETNFYSNKKNTDINFALHIPLSEGLDEPL